MLDAGNPGETYHACYISKLSRFMGTLPAPATSVTTLLQAWSGGDRAALDAVMPLVHQELKRLARRHLRHERADHTIQPTALVNEAYLRLVGENRMHWRSRAHFLAVSAQLMRFVLVDHARRRVAARRGGADRPVILDVDLLPAEAMSMDRLLALDAALAGLSAIDERKARLVEMRAFAGLSVEECADVLGVSAVTVMRDWRFARAWLQHELTR